MPLQAEVDAIRADWSEGKGEVRELASELAGISSDLRGLLQGEAQLAKAEAKEQVGIAIKVTMWGAVAAVAALLTLVWVALTATYALANAIEPWLAALVVTVGLALLTLMAAMLAKSRLSKFSLVPKRTVRAVKEDISWAKHQMNSQPTSSESATR